VCCVAFTTLIGADPGIFSVADTKVSQVNITVRKQHHRKPSQHVPDHAQADPEGPAEATTKITEAKTEQPTASTIVRMKSIAELKRVSSREVILGMMDAKASRPVSASEARSFGKCFSAPSYETRPNDFRTKPKTRESARSNQ
jgi:hypothetical protein